MESKLPTRSVLSAIPRNSRLPAPTSKLKPPVITSKRSRSPEQAPSAKRQRTYHSGENTQQKKPAAGEKLRPSNSTGSLSKPNTTISKRRSLTKTTASATKRRSLPRSGTNVAKRLVTQTSGGNLKAPVARNTNTRPISAKPPIKSGNTTQSATAAPKAGGTKRPAWDLKGRLQDMEESMKRKENQMAEWSARIGSLECVNTQLTGTVAQTEEVATNVGKEKERLEKRLAETESQLYEIKRKLERDTEDFEFTKASLKRQKDALESELSALQTEAAGLKTSIAQLTSAQAGLKSELTSTQVSLTNALNAGQEKDDMIVQLKGIISANTETIKDFEQKFRDFETERRILHNTVQELKGNIRVFCRVRPLLGEELLGNDGEINHMNFSNDNSLELEKLSDISLSESTINSTRRGANGRYTFAFDKVFLPESTQTAVFEEISQLVQSALDGYNVCIFAYGQTGSGKTFTMEGPSVEDEETMGMISRATIQIFKSTKGLEEQGWQYEFEASFLEIYNETIRDLLGNHGNGVKHEIRLGTGGKDVTVTNLTTQTVSGKDQIIHLLRTASKNRAVGETQCNERSSRSHSVFRLKITGSNEITGENCAVISRRQFTYPCSLDPNQYYHLLTWSWQCRRNAIPITQHAMEGSHYLHFYGLSMERTLNLIDLAGSERLKESGATGARLKETQNINSSLSDLGNVIMALGNKDAHVPYRNSKLTYLLQNSLGGNSKTLMFVNVSPREEHFSETLNSLRFATKVCGYPKVLCFSRDKYRPEWFLSTINVDLFIWNSSSNICEISVVLGKVNQCNIGTATKKTKHVK